MRMPRSRDLPCRNLRGWHPANRADIPLGSLLKGIGWIDFFLSQYEKHLLRKAFNRCVALGAVLPVSKSYETGRTVYPARSRRKGLRTHSRSPAHKSDGAVRGRIDRSSGWKGLDVLFQSIALLRSEVPDVRLNMVGAGHAVPQLQSSARRLGMMTSFVGRAHSTARHSLRNIAVQDRWCCRRRQSVNRSAWS